MYMLFEGGLYEKHNAIFFPMPVFLAYELAHGRCLIRSIAVLRMNTSLS